MIEHEEGKIICASGCSTMQRRLGQFPRQQLVASPGIAMLACIYIGPLIDIAGSVLSYSPLYWVTAHCIELQPTVLNYSPQRRLVPFPRQWLVASLGIAMLACIYFGPQIDIAGSVLSYSPLYWVTGHCIELQPTVLSYSPQRRLVPFPRQWLVASPGIAMLACIYIGPLIDIAGSVLIYSPLYFCLPAGHKLDCWDGKCCYYFILRIRAVASSIVSLDVISLFPKIPTNQTLAVVQDKLTVDPLLGERTYIRNDNQMDMLTFWGETNYFRIGSNIFRQEDGLVMGSLLSPVLANIYMENSKKWN